MAEVIATFENKEDGVKSWVTIGDRGFHVSLEDTDAGEFVGSVICFNAEDLAIAKAKEIVG